MARWTDPMRPAAPVTRIGLSTFFMSLASQHQAAHIPGSIELRPVARRQTLEFRAAKVGQQVLRNASGEIRIVLTPNESSRHSQRAELAQSRCVPSDLGK